MGILDRGHPIRPDLLDAIEAQIRTHHTLYRRGRAKAEQWEELLSNALSVTGYPNVWQSGSHAVGTDITLADGTTISAKSGTHNEITKTLEFSGSRLGRFRGNITDMVAHVNSSRSDYYAFAAGPKNFDGIRYDIFFIPKVSIFYGTEANWTVENEDTSSPVWRFTGPLLEARIVGSMSHQIWTTLALEAMGQSPARSFVI